MPDCEPWPACWETYNDLKDDFGNYRASLSVSNRLFNNKLGIIATGNYQKVNRSNEFIILDYEKLGFDPVTEDPILAISNLNLGDKLENRTRYGASLTMDYEFNPKHSLLFSSGFGHTDRDRLRYRRRYRKAENYQEFDIRQTQNKVSLWTASLSGEHNFGKLDVNWRGSMSRSDQRTPEQFTTRFRENSALSGLVESTTDPDLFFSFFKKRPWQYYFQRYPLSNLCLSTRNHTTFQLDLKYNFTLFQRDQRNYQSRRKDEAGSSRPGEVRNLFCGPTCRVIIRQLMNRSYFITSNKSNHPPIQLANFIGTYTNDDFFGGRFDIIPGTPEGRDTFFTLVEDVDINAYNELFGTNYKIGDSIRYQGHMDIDKAKRFFERYQSIYRQNLEVELEDYDGNEKYYGSLSDGGDQPRPQSHVIRRFSDGRYPADLFQSTRYSQRSGGRRNPAFSI